MMKKKIIRISTVPISLESLLKGQLKMLNEHYEVIAVSSPGKALDTVRQREGVRTIAVPMERHISLLKDLLSLIRLIILFLRERPEMVHSITPKAGLLSMLAAWITRVPIRMHTFTGLIFPTASGKMQKLLMLMDKLTCACASHINPEGEGVKQDLQNYHITRKPLHILANGNVNGIDMSYYNRTPEILQEAKKYRQAGCFTFCFIGRMVRDKGINELIYAFQHLYQQYPHVRLLLIGPFEQKLDPIAPDTEHMIFHHPAIRFMDFQPDVRPFLAASDALVFPSYREGFPNVVLQAGAIGLPSIVTDINGCNEIIIPHKNGIIIPPRNKTALYSSMEYFLSHPEDVMHMASQARELVAARYDQHLVWDALLTQYKQILTQ